MTSMCVRRELFAPHRSGVENHPRAMNGKGVDNPNRSLPVSRRSRAMGKMGETTGSRMRVSTVFALACVVVIAVTALPGADAVVDAWSTGCEPARIGQMCKMYARASRGNTPSPPPQYVSWSRIGASSRNEVLLLSRTEVPWLGPPIKTRLPRKSGMRGITGTAVSSKGVVTSALIFNVTKNTDGWYRCNYYLDGSVAEFHVNITAAATEGGK
ncbi:bORF12 [Murid betaherpesvirus 8]|uniref:BORF12 n=1 Tax=Rat cytomegalovirus (isolate England) TaxID=1261657 RepID=A0A0E3X3N4_RCMVE|nr:bORF12 [Murid betaherpesvirus 8]WPH25062.1 bORF12 [Murid betaherpesvirus 8]WPH25196.1 bORF12 [Murid betaherpesvirus 8]